MVGVGGTHHPVAKGDAHQRQTALGNPREIVTGDPACPVGTQPRRRLLPQFDAPGRFIGCLKPSKEAGNHPLFEHQPRTKVNSSER